MKCHEFKTYLSPYLDSELSRDALHQIGAHLEECEGCRSRFEAERDLERLMKQTLLAPETGDEKIWERAFSRALTVKERKVDGRKKVILSLAALLLLATSLFFFLNSLPHRELDLAEAVSQYYHRYLSGEISIALSESEKMLKRYGLDKKILQSLEKKYSPLGTRLCYLRKVPCTVVALHKAGTPALVFIFDKEGLQFFPDVKKKLAKKRTVHCKVGKLSFCTVVEGDLVYAVIAETGPEELDQILAGFFSR